MELFSRYVELDPKARFVVKSQRKERRESDGKCDDRSSPKVRDLTIRNGDLSNTNGN
jgi:hypothetical protein